MIAPETLSVRAVNQYRRRDVIAYLGVRLYLDNPAAARDRWAESVSSRLVLHDSAPKYYSSLHFKERNTDTGEIEYRSLSLPTPNEIYAETALLAECAKAGGIFSTSPSAYSYRLANGDDRKGVYQPYFIGFRNRHDHIADAARRHLDGVVLYTDIKRFYPSITTQIASSAWQLAATEAELPIWARKLGNRILENYRINLSDNEHGILTGPMFSHLIANLSLRQVDSTMSQILPGGYFRYVDDFALVGSREDVSRAEKLLSRLLSRMGLSINNDKRLETAASMWLHSAHDFSESHHRVSWKTFIGRMKQLLITRPDLTDEITEQLASEGFRIAPLNYSEAVTQKTYLDALRDLITTKWFPRQTYRATPERLIVEAKSLRDRYESEFWLAIGGAGGSTAYDRKRMIYQLRRLSSRLIYLANPEKLPGMSKALSELPEMALHAAIFDALARRDVSELVLYGANAAHSVAQGFLSTNPTLKCAPSHWSKAARQARAVMVAHGLRFQESSPASHSDTERFCSWDDLGQEYLDSPTTYFGELGLLHGVGKTRRHEGLLSKAFDTDEDMIVEIEDVLHQSY